MNDLLKGTAEPTKSGMKPTERKTASHYAETFSHDEEAKTQISEIDKTHNFKSTFESNYANEWIKMRANLRLL